MQLASSRHDSASKRRNLYLGPFLLRGHAVVLKARLLGRPFLTRSCRSSRRSWSARLSRCPNRANGKAVYFRLFRLDS